MATLLTFLRRRLANVFRSSPLTIDAVIAALQRRGYTVLRFQAVSVAAIEAEIAHVPASSRLVIFAIIDDEVPISLPGHVAAIFRTSLGHPRHAREHGLPFFFEPMTLLDPVPRGTLPRLSFCGTVSSHPIRGECLPLVMADERVQTDCILRTKFWGGKVHDPQLMREYRDNMQRSEFNLCLRGGGNFSMRLYHVLSAGRIPVLIVEDLAQDLAWSDTVPWERTCVIASSVESVVPAILDFWSSRDIVAAQLSCRRMYMKYFAGRGLMKGIYRRCR